MENEEEITEEKFKRTVDNKNAKFIKLLESLGTDLKLNFSGIKLEELTYLLPHRNSDKCKESLEDLKRAIALTIQINQHCIDLYKEELSENSASTDSSNEKIV